MGGFMKYLNKIQSIDLNDIVEEEVEEEVVEVVETVEAPKPKQPIVKKPTQPQKVDSSVSVIEERMRSKLDDVGLKPKIISEVVSFVLSDVKNVKDFKQPRPVQSQTSQYQGEQTKNIHEYSYNNDIAGAASYILDGVSNSSSTNTSSTTNNESKAYTSNVADRASSLL